MKKIFIDLETTGVDPRKNSIHQISMIIEVNGHVLSKHNIKIRPHEKAIIEPEALNICRVTKEQILEYPARRKVFPKIVKLLQRNIDRYNTQDKAYFIGYNSRAFDELFFRALFEQMGNPYYGSFFWPDGLDVMVLASQYLLDRREEMANFKLKTVAKELGIIVYTEKLHDAQYDNYLTREIYQIVTGIKEEI